MRARTIARWICLGYVGLLLVLAVGVGVLAAYTLIADPHPGAPSWLGRWARVMYSLREPIVYGLLAAAGVSVVVGAVLVRGLWRGRRLALAATAVIAVALLGGLYEGTRVLRTIEGRYYKKSAYVRTYLAIGWPLAGASILALAAGVFGAIRRERA